MANIAWDIDTIVQAVLRRLGESSETAPTAVCATPPAAPSATACPAGDALSVTAPVVSLAVLEAQLADRPVDALVARGVPPAAVAMKLDGLQHLVVQRGAVVTPAVRDLLREHGVALVTALGSQSPGRGEVSLAVAAVAANDVLTTLVNTLSRETTVAAIEAADLAETVSGLVARIDSGAWLGLLVTDQSAAALCLANRYRAVRAAAVHAAADVPAVMRAIAANLLVVDSARCGTAAVAAIARTFLQQGPQPCPAALRCALDGGEVSAKT